MAIVDDVPGAHAPLSRTTHARTFGGGRFPPTVLRQIVDARCTDRRSLVDAVRWL